MNKGDDLCLTCKHRRSKHYYHPPHVCYDRASVYLTNKDGYANYVPEPCRCLGFSEREQVPFEIIEAFSDSLNNGENEGFLDNRVLENAFKENYDKLQKFFKEQP